MINLNSNKKVFNYKNYNQNYNNLIIYNNNMINKIYILMI